VQLFKAAAPNLTTFAPVASWADTFEHAGFYTKMLGFGGPTVYVAEVNPSHVLDLRQDTWQRVEAEFAIERADYGEGKRDHDLLRGLVPVFLAHGYEWVVFRVSGAGTEWLHIAGEPVAAHVTTGRRAEFNRQGVAHAPGPKPAD
jgi:hypothetical protein